MYEVACIILIVKRLVSLSLIRRSATFKKCLFFNENIDFLQKLLAFGRSIIRNHRGSHSEMFLKKGVLKTCSRFTGEHPCRSSFSIKLQKPVKFIKEMISTRKSIIFM